MNAVFHEVHEGKKPFKCQMLEAWTIPATSHALCVYIPEVPVDNDDFDEDGDRVHYECS